MKSRFRTNPWAPLLFFAMLALILIVIGNFAFRHVESEIRQEKVNELSAIASLKIDLLTGWVKERENDARSVSQDEFLLPAVIHWLRQSSLQGDLKLKIRHRLAALANIYGYENILLLDSTGNLLLSARNSQSGIDDRVQHLAQQTMQNKAPLLDDPRRTPGTTAVITLDLAVPLVLPSDKEEPAGALVFRLDPNQALYPMIQSWPTLSASAESLLVKRDGNDVLFLNELRHRAHTATTLRLPVNSPNLPAAMALRGYEGVTEGIDYRGKPVLSAIRKLPGTNWFLIAKVDKDEIFAAIRQISQLTLSIVVLLIAVAAALTMLWWRQQRTQFALDQSSSELERQALVQHFDYLAKYANDIILLADDSTRIIEANDAALKAYGYSREELIGIKGSELRVPVLRDTFDTDVDFIRRKNSALFECVHVRKDGSTFPVEVSARHIYIEGKPFFQLIIRDITERKAVQERLEQQLDELRHFQKATVGRELRMKELSEENQILKARLAQPDQKKQP